MTSIVVTSLPCLGTCEANSTPDRDYSRLCEQSQCIKLEWRNLWNISGSTGFGGNVRFSLSGYAIHLHVPRSKTAQ
jgi:hypothetical protein